MAGRLLSVLLLAAHGAHALDANLHPQALAAVVAAATTTDPGLLACATAEALVEVCYSAGSLASTVPLATAAACLCCYKGANVSPQYLSCESYVAASAKSATDAYSTASLAYAICTQAGNVCGGAAATTTPAVTSPSGAASKTTAVGSAAAACSTVISAVNLCSNSNVKSVAACLCYDSNNRYNTVFDDFVSACEPYAKTAYASTLYSAIVSIETFCEDYPPSTSAAVGSTAKGTSATATSKSASTTSTGGLTGLAASGSTSALPTTTVFVTKSSSALAHQGSAGGVVVWLANAATFVTSFFFML